MKKLPKIKLSTFRVPLPPTKKFFPFAALVLIFGLAIILYSLYKPQSSQAAWFNENWGYRQQITATVTSNASDITNLQTLLTVNTSALVSAGKLQSSCQDLRFTAQNGTILPFYIDSGCNTTTTKIWILADLVPKNTTTYSLLIYYGNSSAPAVSDSYSDKFNLLQGLVGYWTMNESSWTNNCSTGSIIDSSVNANNGKSCPTSTGPTGGATGQYGNAGSFDGSDDHVFITKSSPLNITGDMTISTWVKGTISATGTDTILMNGTAANATIGYRLSMGSTPGGFVFQLGNGTSTTNAATATTTTSSGTWYHVVATVSGTDMKIYLNGQLDGSATFSGSRQAANYNLGIGRQMDGDVAYTGNTNFNLNGSVDDSRIYNRALSSTEISQLYTNPGTIATTATATSTPSTSFASEEKAPQPVGYWKFDDGQGTTAQDSTTNNNDGTLTNASWVEEGRCLSGKCLYFNGTAKVQTSTVANIPTGNTSRTLEAWIKPYNNGGVVMSLNTASGQKFILMTFNSTGTYFLFTDAVNSGNNITLTGSEIPTFTQWNHITLVLNSSTSWSYYLNGKFVKSGTFSVAINTNTLSSVAVGNRLDISGQEFSGFIDEPKIYNYARSASQIQADYSAPGNPQGVAGVLGTSFQNNPSALTNGLVAYWPMNETSWTNNCSTNTVFDASGSSNSGKACPNSTGPTGGATGKFGNGGSFDGSNDYLDVYNSNFNNPTTAITVSAWVKVNTHKNWNMVLQRDNFIAVGKNSWDLLTRSDGTAGFAISEGTTQYGANSTTALTTGQWYLLTGTYDGNTAKLYVNGTLEGTASKTGLVFSSLTALNIGRNVGNGGDLFNGSIDEPRIYNRALSSSDAQALYNFAPGPIGYWNMEEKTGSTTADQSGNSNTGTLSGATWTNGKYGGAVSYAGTDDTVSVANNAVLNLGTGNFTLEAWIKGNNMSNGDVILAKTNGGAASTSYGFHFSAFDSLYPTLHFASSATALTKIQGTQSLTNGQWYHIAMAVDRATSANNQVYINGVPVTTTVANLSTNTGSITNTVALAIGNESDGGFSWDGNIDDVKIYNYTRSAKQVVSDMNAAHPNVGSPVGSAVAYWKFDEGSDNICSGGANDVCNSGSAGSALDGSNTLMSAPATASSGWSNSGKFGKTLNFDGTDDYVYVGDSANLEFNSTDSQMTIAGWIKPDASTGDRAILAKYNSNANQAEYTFHINNTTQNLNFWVSEDGTVDTATTLWKTSSPNNSITFGVWQHVAVTLDLATDTIKYYINGKQVSTTNNSTVTSINNMSDFAEPARIGTMICGAGSLCNQWDGNIDELKVYRYALTSDEVKLDMNQGSSEVLGTLSDNSTYQKSAANQEYCVPGDATSCAAPTARWDMEEGTGTTANDTSGNSNTGTLTNGPTWANNSKIGKALNFDGTDDYVTTQSKTYGPNLTIEAWVYPTTTGINTTILSTCDDPNSSCSGSDYKTMALRITGDKVEILLAPSNFSTRRVYSTTSAVQITAANRWYHLAGTIDMSTNSGRIFVNGIEQSVTTSNASTGTQSFTASPFIGAANNVFDGAHYAFFAGKIDQLQVYDYVRTPSQIAWDYNKGAPVAWYKMDECQGSVVNDSSGNSNTGTLSVGASGTQTSVGTCITSSTAWGNGATGKFNSSLNFDGTNDYVQVGNPTSLQFTTSFSIASWVKTTSSSSSMVILSKYRNNSGANATPYYMQISSGVASIAIDTLNSCSSVSTMAIRSSTSTVNDGNWHHIVGVYNSVSQTLNIYVDGKLNNGALSGSVSTVIPNCTDSVQIGALEGNGSDVQSAFFAGQIDDVRAYSYPLTGSLIQNIYNQGSSTRFGPATGTP